MPSPYSEDLQFCLRHDRDGTINSFCLKCFVTVSRGECNEDRAQREQSHVCNIYEVERFAVAMIPSANPNKASFAEHSLSRSREKPLNADAN